MDQLLLARFQFASTTIFHFLFVPLSIGLVFMVALMETLHVFKKKPVYRKMAIFWGHLFLLNFAVGVVTGIIQEFQFGMNWSDYSRFVGDVFGAPLAIEALLAFFMESTFIGIWIFGRDRLSPKVHLMSIWLVALGTILSAFWILAANSFMQEPVGFQMVNGRAEMNDFAALLTNPQLMVEFPHVIFGALCTGAFFIAGVSGFQMAKKRHMEFYKPSLRIALIVALVGALGVAFSGHWQGQHLVKTQPMKMAAAEGLWEDSADPAAWSLIANINVMEQKNDFDLEIPYALSYLSYSKFSGSVEGMKTLQAKYEKKYASVAGENMNYIPPVKTTYWSFRGMVFSGMAMLFMAALGLFLDWRRKLESSTLYLKLLAPVIALPFLANSFGWVMTEIGRQPWVVFGYQTTANAVSPNVSAGSILFSTILFIAIFAILAAVLVFLMVKTIKAGPYHDEEHQDKETVDPFEEGGYKHES